MYMHSFIHTYRFPMYVWRDGESENQKKPAARGIEPESPSNKQLDSKPKLKGGLSSSSIQGHVHCQGQQLRRAVDQGLACQHSARVCVSDFNPWGVGAAGVSPSCKKKACKHELLGPLPLPSGSALPSSENTRFLLLLHGWSPPCPQGKFGSTDCTRSRRAERVGFNQGWFGSCLFSCMSHSVLSCTPSPLDNDMHQTSQTTMRLRTRSQISSDFAEQKRPRKVEVKTTNQGRTNHEVHIVNWNTGIFEAQPGWKCLIHCLHFTV